MQFIESEICEFTKLIWNNTLGLEVEKTDLPFKHEEKNKNLAGCVHITGTWNGTVALHCPTELARQAAAIMFDLDNGSATNEEIQDALGELSNMTSGNIKSLLPEPSYLSLPAVAITDYNLRIPGSELVTNITFKCNDHLFAVTLLRKEEGKES